MLEREGLGRAGRRQRRRGCAGGEEGRVEALEEAAVEVRRAAADAETAGEDGLGCAGGVSAVEKSQRRDALEETPAWMLPSITRQSLRSRSEIAASDR